MLAQRIALAQINTTVGALDHNRALVVAAARDANAGGARLVVFPEMALTGYAVEDLALTPSFVRAAAASAPTLARELAEAGMGDVVVIVGGLGLPADDGAVGALAGLPANRAFVLHEGVVRAHYDKQRLPGSGVFDEARTFAPGAAPCVIDVDGARVGIAICEDIWPADSGTALRAGADASSAARDAGPARDRSSEHPDVSFGEHLDLLVVLNASPFESGKAALRATVIAECAASVGAPVAYVNLVGGQDELVFDGGSTLVAPDATIVARAPQFEPATLVVDLPGQGAPASDSVAAGSSRAALAPVIDGDGEVYQAIVTGLRDYVRKNGFSSVVLGMSGGIDSALLAVIAADAIGGENVVGVSMPSSFSSQHSRDDASDLAARIGADIRTHTIAAMVEVFERDLGLTDVSVENLQARVRGVILMGLSNQEGHLVLAPGNKSELAVGYSTIYGDAVGGYGPIKDVFKSQVWALARWRNNAALDAGVIPPIPESSITKPPSAELRPGQVDQDSLPPYDILDRVLAGYVEQRLGRVELIDAGFDADIVSKVTGLVDRAEWKRRQYPIGPKVSAMAFGRDRRLPITSKWS